MKRILIKTVNKGTGVKTITPGLVVGGKTGTAHIVEDGKYVNKYNTSFIGFVNDHKHKYTMGVVVIQPKKVSLLHKQQFLCLKKRSILWLKMDIYNQILSSNLVCPTIASTKIIVLPTSTFLIGSNSRFTIST